MSPPLVDEVAPRPEEDTATLELAPARHGRVRGSEQRAPRLAVANELHPLLEARHLRPPHRSIQHQLKSEQCVVLSQELVLLLCIVRYP